MKIRVFQSGAGDCLLVSDTTRGKHMLVDGGLRTPFRKHAMPTLSALPEEEQIDVVCVSHDDQDHISGILGMIEDLVDHKVYEYHHERDNPQAREPRNKRPPELGELWHNAFRAQLPDDFRAVQSFVNTIATGLASAASPALFANYVDFAKFRASEKESLELSHLTGVSGLRLPVNEPAGGEGALMLVDPGAAAIPLGDLAIRVIGPRDEDIERLREHWATWLSDHESVLDEVRQEHADAEQYLQAGDLQRWQMDLNLLAQKIGDRSKVTLPNLASLMLFVEHGEKTLVLTGDGHRDEVLSGLEAIGKAPPLHVDVLKIPHHGSEYNSDVDFYEQLTADRYVFCGNGAHENPDTRIVDALMTARITNGAGPNQAFEVIFNAHPDDTSNTDTRRAHMQALVDRVDEWYAANPTAFGYTFFWSSHLDIAL